MAKEMGNMVIDTISVDSDDEFAKKIEAEGGKILTEKMSVPGMDDTGSFQDTEGNVFAIIEFKME